MACRRNVKLRRCLLTLSPELSGPTLAISGDGKKIVYSYELELFVMDFKTAFKIESLPPNLGLEEPVLTSR